MEPSKSSSRQVDSCIQLAKKGVREALKLDSQGKKKNAYLQYLRCVQFIADSLLKDADNTGGRDLSTSNTRKMTKLCQQCVDRAADLLTEIDDSEEISIDFRRPISEASIPRHKPPSTNQQPASLPNNEPQTNISMFPDVPTTTQQLSSVSTAGPQQPHAHLQTPPSFHRQHSSVRRNEPSPTEIAYRKNQQLLAGFKARMSRTKNEKHRSMLSLKLQRQLLENMSLARAQEAAITKKVQERHMMLMEEASRRFSSTGEPTADELERRQVYASVLEYEHQTIWLKSWRTKLSQSPQDLDLINALVSKILACQDHPLTQLLQKYQLEIQTKVEPLLKEADTALCAITVPYNGIDKLNFTDGHINVRSESFTKLDRAEAILQDDLSKRLSQSPGKLQDNITSLHLSEEDYFLDEDEMFNDCNEDELDDFSISDLSSEASNRLSKDGTKSASPYGARNSVEDYESSPNEKETSYGQDVSDHQNDLAKTVDSTSTIKDENDSSKSTGNMDSSIEHIGNNDSEVDLDKEETSASMGEVVETVKGNIDHALQESEEEAKKLMESIKNDIESAVQKEINVEGKITADAGELKDGQDKDCEINGISEKTDSVTSHVEEDLELSNGDNEEQKIKKLTEEAYARHLKAIIKDTHLCIEKLLSMFVAVYEELDSRNARERCTLLIEDPFFHEIWPMLLKLFRIANLSKERNAAIAMTRYQGSLPEHVGVIKKFCLSTVDTTSDPTSFPYKRAVDELVKLTTFKNPLSKLECIVRTSRNIVRCVEEHYDSIGKPGYRIGNAIGCDDFLPILSYIVVKTASPQIVSECSAMEEFIHEGYLFGEEGYCLTSLQTALGYVLRSLVTM
ncbi:VPS9 domain-containing protein 1-like [Anneissia japonica]|uniref:VPS9 domain-containing protein 1-like n=1 Tax=Anneissia japonica TaxID=1529436 RepID=UPI001425A811|nr:VPS9 domain-containing protein 1-like [Anneissia japonica]XP_033112283.1 VPS9 domain-containing protein 1-like [Anneissia japonica]XP_033112284.1 VPS9 domain-containing protein 1-like [Anneissia japonica]XP_033112285.1 VPS9 domain-containing protein 1-like [Anneissia japonica]